MLHLLLGIILFLLVFHFFVFHEYNSPWYAKMIDKVPGPKGIFYLGSSLVFNNLKSEERIGYMGKLYETYGPTFRIWLSGKPIILTMSPENLQIVLGSRLESYKGMLYNPMKKWLGEGLLLSSKKKWQTHRKIITPTFHFSILQNFVPVFNKNAERLVQSLKKTDLNKVDLLQFLQTTALDNICETAMGVSAKTQNGSPDKYESDVVRLAEICGERLISPLFTLDRVFALVPTGWEYHRILGRLHKFTEKIIWDLKGALKSANLEKSDDINVGKYKRKETFLKLLLEKQEESGMSDLDIREEVDTFMFEGHDTTTMAMTWTLHELACAPEIQNLCYEEQKKIMGNSNEMPTYQNLTEMTYLKQCIMETLRLHPSVPFVSRVFEEDLQLKDHLIPKGTEIFIDIYHAHRNTEIYPDPDKFDPLRFTQEAMSSRNSYAYVPFSAGLRNCVGQKFAMLEILSTISNMIRNYKLESLSERNFEETPLLTLRPFGTIYWKLTPREQS